MKVTRQTAQGRYSLLIERRCAVVKLNVQFQRKQRLELLKVINSPAEFALLEQPGRKPVPSTCETNQLARVLPISARKSASLAVLQSSTTPLTLHQSTRPRAV